MSKRLQRRLLAGAANVILLGLRNLLRIEIISSFVPEANTCKPMNANGLQTGCVEWIHSDTARSTRPCPMDTRLREQGQTLRESEARAAQLDDGLDPFDNPTR